jgi:hypothetical protein
MRDSRTISYSETPRSKIRYEPVPTLLQPTDGQSIHPLLSAMPESPAHRCLLVRAFRLYYTGSKAIEREHSKVSFRRLVQIRPQPFRGAELLQSLRVSSSLFVLRKPGTRLARPELLPTDDQFASGDEQFLKKLKHAVTRGQKGRIAEGMIHGGRYYGYKTVAIADPTKRSTASKTAIKGVKLVIDDVAAAAVRAIFGWAEEGRSFRQIATDCSDANFPRPCTISGAAGVWTRDCLRSNCGGCGSIDN